jgi:hypothetical protein
MYRTLHSTAAKYTFLFPLSTILVENPLRWTMKMPSTNLKESKSYRA